MATRPSQAATPPYQPLGDGGARLNPSRAVSNSAATVPGTQQHALKRFDGTSRGLSMGPDGLAHASTVPTAHHRSQSVASSLMAPSLHDDDVDHDSHGNVAAEEIDAVASPRALRLEHPGVSSDVAAAAASAAAARIAEHAAQEVAARETKRAAVDGLWNITLCEAREASAVLALALHRGKGRREAERRAVAAKRRSADAERHLPAELLGVSSSVAGFGRTRRLPHQSVAAAAPALESLREAGAGLQGSPFAIRQILTPMALPEDTAVPHHRSSYPRNRSATPPIPVAAVPAPVSATSPTSTSQPVPADISVASSRPATDPRSLGLVAAGPASPPLVYRPEDPSRELRFAGAAASPPAHMAHYPEAGGGQPSGGSSGFMRHTPTTMSSSTAGAASPSPHQPQPLPERKRHAGPRAGDARPAAAHVQDQMPAPAPVQQQQRRSLPATSHAGPVPASPTPATVQPRHDDAESEASEPTSSSQVLRRRGHGTSLPIAPGVMDRSSPPQSQTRGSPSSGSRARQGSRSGGGAQPLPTTTTGSPRSRQGSGKQRTAVAPQSEDEFFSFNSI